MAPTEAGATRIDRGGPGELAGPGGRSELLAGLGGMVLGDVDDSIVDVHGPAEQRAGFGFTRVRGLNRLLVTVSTAPTVSVVVAQRLRRGSCDSPRGAKGLVAAALRTARRLRAADGGNTGNMTAGPVLLRADSAFYGSPTIGAAVRAEVQVPVPVRMDSQVKTAVAMIAEDAWKPIEYREVNRAAARNHPTKVICCRARGGLSIETQQLVNTEDDSTWSN